LGVEGLRQQYQQSYYSSKTATEKVSQQLRISTAIGYQQLKVWFFFCITSFHLPFIPLLGVLATTYGHPTGAGEKQNETTAAQLQMNQVFPAMKRTIRMGV